MPEVIPETVIRLSLDINVFYADLRSTERRIKATACSFLVDCVRDGRCAAGSVQFVTSVAMIENWADVLRRKFGYSTEDASQMAWLLQDYASEGPLALHPQIVVGSGFLPFDGEAAMRQAVETHMRPKNADKLFDEIADDRHVLLSALAGRADILATADLDGFTRGPAIGQQREDVILFPLADHTLVIAKPSFVAYWLRLGIVPDQHFVASRPDEFRPARSTPRRG